MSITYRKKYRRTTTTTKWNTPKFTFKSPYATTFASSIKKGVPCSVVVTNISKKTGKNTKAIFTSLCKAGLCKGQKINGQWIYWPTIKVRTNISNAKTSKVNMWQCFVDWCITSGTCTPKQINSKSINTKTFAKFCKTGFGKTVKSAGTIGGAKTRKTKKTKSTKKRSYASMRRLSTKRTNRWTTGRKTFTTAWSTKRYGKNRKRTAAKKSIRFGGYNTRTYKFPVFKTRWNTNLRRYRHAA